MTVRELLARTDSRDLAEWEAVYKLDPWGEERADLRAARIIAKIHNVNRGSNDDPADPADLMPVFGQKYRDQFAAERELEKDREEQARKHAERIDAVMGSFGRGRKG